MATKSKATKKKTETIEAIIRRIVKEEIKKHLSIRLCTWSEGGDSARLEWDGNDLDDDD